MHNLSLCRQIFEHCQIVQIFPPVPEMIKQIQSDPFPLGYGLRDIFQKLFFSDFFKKFPPDFLHSKTYSLKYRTRLPSVGQPVIPSCPSVIPSFRHSVNQNLKSFSQPFPGSGLVILQRKKASIKKYFRSIVNTKKRD